MTTVERPRWWRITFERDLIRPYSYFTVLATAVEDAAAVSAHDPRWPRARVALDPILRASAPRCAHPNFYREPITSGANAVGVIAMRPGRWRCADCGAEV